MKICSSLLFSLALSAPAIAGCSGTAKEDISSAPVDVDLLDAKEDSATKPSKGHDARVAEQITDKLTATRGFIAHQIHLSGGRVDIDVSGLENGDQLDTIMWVYGPKKPNGKFSTPALAFNDDFEPGVNFGSHIVLNVPTEGDYLIVVSSYENYIYFPNHVSRGDYTLMVKCQDPAFEACGPAVSGVDGQCWEDNDCVATDGTPLHCEGEITCAPGTQCLFVRVGTCVEDYVYMTYSPKQCTNPWSATAVEPEEQDAFPADLGQVKKHYGKQGVAFDELGQLTPAEPTFHCLACGCARGDQLLVKIPATHAATLADDGWIFSAPDPGAMAFEAKQCGSNPWETAPSSSPAEELELVDTWFANEGAKVPVRGFLYPAEPKIVCAACSCPRGDRLVAFPLDQEAHGFLSSLGFADVYVP